MKKQIIYLTAVMLLFVFSTSCKKEKDAELPEVEFKQGAGYVSANANLEKNNRVTIGILGSRKKAALKTFSVYQSYDNSTYQMVYNYTLLNSESDSFSQDYEITTRNEKGTEKYKFTLTDADGNTGFKELTFKVQ